MNAKWLGKVAEGVRNICMMYAGYMTHIVREFCT
jgi:hypothetical protein